MTVQGLNPAKHLFQPFVRGDSAERLAETGLGPGFIVQRIIDNHNGKLELAPANAADHQFAPGCRYR